MLLSLIAGAVLASTHPMDFYADGPYDPSVPKLESILHYGPAEKITNYRDQERVLKAIAEKSKSRVKEIEFGKSVEGRPLHVFVISSPENMARLDEIRTAHQAIANGKADAATIAKTPPILWVNECIHGDEPASFESGMYLIYNLAASQNHSVLDALKKAVVIVNPVYNPDGHERYAVYYDSIAVGSSDPDAYEASEPSAIHGRVNHYRFDMNRDRVAMSQDETRQEVAEFLRWSPQVYADQHGQVDSYFFPPNPMSVNANVDRKRVNHWTDVLGRATGKAFDAHGFSYFIKDEFDLYYPGYLDSFTSLSGAIGMTHETDGGKELNRTRSDGSILTLRDGVEKHFTSAMALVRATADHSRELMDSFAEFKTKAVKGELAGKFQRVVLVSEDARPLERLQKQLESCGIMARWNIAPFKQGDANDYWTGQRGEMTFPMNSLVVDMAQSQGPLAKTLLEPGSDFEPEFFKAQQNKKKTAPDGEKYPGPDGAEFYDTTGWSLPFAHNLKAWWCESAPSVALSGNPFKPRERAQTKDSTVGYALEYTDINDVLAVCDALNQDIHGSVTTKPMSLAGRKFKAGTFLFLSSHNDEDLKKKLDEIAKDRNVRFVSLTTSYPDEDRNGPGSGSVSALRKPNIAVVFGRGADMAPAGSIWYLLDRVFKLPFTPIRTDALSGDLSRFSCILLPYGSGGTTSGKLRDWVSSGGALISLGGPNWALGSSGFVDLNSIKGEPQSLPGSLFRANLDSRSFLSYGYPEGKEIAVPIAGDRFYQTKKEGGSIVTLSADEKFNKLLSGWEYTDDTEKNLAGTVWLQDAPVGRGHALLFFQDPSERAMFPGLYKMLLNAILMGPG